MSPKPQTTDRPYALETDDELAYDIGTNSRDLGHMISVSKWLREPSEEIEATIRAVMRQRRLMTLEQLRRQKARK